MTTTIDARQLLGTWELVAWTRITPSGEASYPMSDKASGRIIYDASGLMSAFLMDPAHVTGGAPPAKGAHHFLSYSGRYAIKGDIVEHDVDLASDPKFVGLILRRRIVQDGEQIVLETLASVGQEARETSHRLVWRRP
jgi:hypothetical protein